MWKRLALVGISDVDIMGRLVAACRGLSLVIVPEWPAKSDQPSERIKQRAREERLRKLCAAYDRVTLLEPDAVPEGTFDAAVLLGLGDDLADVGGVYAGLVRDGGWLMGDDTRDLGTRAILAAVAPGWGRLDDGLWCVRVRRAAVELPDELIPEPADVGADGIGISRVEQPLGLVAEIPGVGQAAEFTHDPIHSGPDVAGAEDLGGGDDLKVDAAGGHDDALSGFAHGDGVELPIGGDDAVEHAAISLDAEASGSLLLGAENDGSDLSHASSDATPTIAPKRRGGRPKGSRNKAKAA
jgi:hypothetical protein